MNRIDFDLIVNELSKGLRDHTDPIVQACGFFRINEQGQHEYCGLDHWYFKEFRTVGLSVPRQMGKTRWIASRLVQEPKALAVTRDEHLVGYMCQFFGTDPFDCFKRVLSIAQVQQRIAAGTLEKYTTYYIDEARHSYHFIEKKLHQYFIDSAQLEPKIVLVS